MSYDMSMYAYFKERTSHLPRTNRTLSFYGKELILSDVLVGGYLTYLIFVALRRAFFGKGKYNFAVALPREEKTE